MAVRLLETVVGVDEGAMPAEGDRVSCRYVAMSRECNTGSAWSDRLTDERCCGLGNSRRHLWPRYDDDAIRNPREGRILDSGRSYSWVVGSGEAIRGLDAAVVLMNEGEHQVWEIPPALA